VGRRDGVEFFGEDLLVAAEVMEGSTAFALRKLCADEQLPGFLVARVLVRQLLCDAAGDSEGAMTQGIVPGGHRQIVAEAPRATRHGLPPVRVEEVRGAFEPELPRQIEDVGALLVVQKRVAAREFVDDQLALEDVDGDVGPDRIAARPPDDEIRRDPLPEPVNVHFDRPCGVIVVAVRKEQAREAVGRNRVGVHGDRRRQPALPPTEIDGCAALTDRSGGRVDNRREFGAGRFKTHGDGHFSLLDVRSAHAPSSTSP
jgi:hypothetical protein